MKKNSSELLLLILSIFIFVFILEFKVAKAEVQTIVVPDDYLSIQAAINNAVNGDTIFVRTGIYEEQMLTLNKTIKLIGQDPTNTVVDLYPPSGPYGILGSWGIDFPVKIEAKNASFCNFNITSHGTQPIAVNGGFISITGSGIKITGNSINTGISAIGNGTIIANNTVTSIFTRGSNQTIAQNIISGEGRGWGVWMEGSVNNVVVNNYVVNASVFGIGLRSSTLNQIFGNNISGNICVQIDNYYGTSNLQTRLSDNNIFYKNNFISNTSTFVDQVGYGYGNYSVANIWYKGTEGNFWSNYEGTDNNGDGIGDTPYVIDENNQDNYPLMEPTIIPEFPFGNILFMLVFFTLIIFFVRNKLGKME